MSFVLDPAPITAQDLLDVVCDLYAAWHFQGGKTNLQFDAQDAAGIAMMRAKRDGLTVKCDLKDPEPPRIDLPLFDAFR